MNSLPYVANTEADRQAMLDAIGVASVDDLFAEGNVQAYALASPPVYSDKHFLAEGDFSRTIHAMGTSLLGWVQGIFDRGLFSDDARVLGLTSEGNQVVWKGYAAVAAAKAALESLARSIAVEYAPYGIRCNIVQAGISETPALAEISGGVLILAGIYISSRAESVAGAEG